MKYFKFNWISVALLFTCFISSCGKQLNVQPTDQVDAHIIFSSIADLQKAVLGVYAIWDEEYMIQISTALSDECTLGSLNNGANGSAVNLFLWTYASSDQNINNAFANPYMVINRANLLLSSINTVPVATPADNTLKQQLQGELLAIRAFAHFELYRTFANASTYNANALALPYVTNINIESKPVRITTHDYLNQLQEDLTQAQSLTQGSNNDITRITPVAIKALQARIALYTNNWANAVSSATEVIQDIPLATMTDFPNIWTNQSNAEVVFKLKRTNLSSISPGGIYLNVPFGIVYFAPSSKLIATYDLVNDIRAGSYFTPNTSYPGQSNYLVNKYAGSVGQQNITDAIVFRTSEMYLIRAEAYLNQGNLNGAQDDLNSLRTARIKNYTPQTYNSSSELLAAILNERYKELAFEGHRYYDLRRLGYTIQRNQADAGQAATTLSPSSPAYIIPIPQQEVLSNPNILPNNTGW